MLEDFQHLLVRNPDSRFVFAHLSDKAAYSFKQAEAAARRKHDHHVVTDVHLLLSLVQTSESVASILSQNASSGDVHRQLEKAFRKDPHGARLAFNNKHSAVEILFSSWELTLQFGLRVIYPEALFLALIRPGREFTMCYEMLYELRPDFYTILLHMIKALDGKRTAHVQM